MHVNLRFAWRGRGLHGGIWVCLEGWGFACMKDLGIAWRFWGLHAWKALGLLRGVGAVAGAAGSTCNCTVALLLQEVFPNCIAALQPREAFAIAPWFCTGGKVLHPAGTKPSCFAPCSRCVHAQIPMQLHKTTFATLSPPPPFAGPVCSPNQHYELCGLSCSPSCSNQEEDDGCNPSSPCTEGCFCNPGYLQSGDSCVPAPQCGCLHDGRYLQRGEEFYPCERCSERCVCKGNGEVQCEPTSCGADEACMVQDGVRGCYPDGCGRCEELGAATFRTFDGVLLHFAGTCTYTLAAAEEGEEEEELEPFLVRVQKEMRGAEPLVRQLLVTVHGVTVSLRRGVHGEVKVSAGCSGGSGLGSWFWGARSFRDAKRSVQTPFLAAEAHVQLLLPMQSNAGAQSRACNPNFRLQSHACDPRSAFKTIPGCEAMHSAPVLHANSSWGAKQCMQPQVWIAKRCMQPQFCVQSNSACKAVLGCKAILHAKPC